MRYRFLHFPARKLLKVVRVDTPPQQQPRAPCSPFSARWTNHLSCLGIRPRRALLPSATPPTPVAPVLPALTGGVPPLAGGEAVEPTDPRGAVLPSPAESAGGPQVSIDSAKLDRRSSSSSGTSSSSSSSSSSSLAFFLLFNGCAYEYEHAAQPLRLVVRHKHEVHGVRRVGPSSWVELPCVAWMMG